MSPTNLKPVFLISILLLFSSSTARTHHAITFRSRSLFPESLLWDPRDQHFIVGSLRRPTLKSVSDAGVVDTLFQGTDSSLPPDSFILGLGLDRRNRRLLAVVHSRISDPPFTAALASFDLKSKKLIHLTPLIDQDKGSDFDDSVDVIKQVTSAGDSLDDGGETLLAADSAAASVALANDVAVDFDGNAFVTSSLNDVIWKVNVDGEASVLSKSPAYKSHQVDASLAFRGVGLNGVAYSSKGYLLVIQSNTGKLFKVDVDNGLARRVILNKDLIGGDGIAMRSDGVVVVVSQEKLYFLKSEDSWGQGAVFDETPLDVEKQASGVAIGDEDRVYVLYGYVNEGVDGNAEREEFSIVEIGSEKEAKEDNVWVFVLIGLGMAYFMFWRFQMKHLVQKMNKKIA